MDLKAKLRPFYVAKMLYEQTDEDHYLTIAQIMEQLEKDYGISTSRGTVGDDIKALQELGVEIEVVPSTQKRFSLIGRRFDLPELKTLIDAVESARFIPKKKSAALVEKLGSLTSQHNTEKLVRNVDVENRIKADNEKIYYIMEALNDAINANKKVSFQYFTYNVRKEQKLKYDGYTYASAADGLGSESNSDDGSRIASQKSCDYCMEHYMSGMPFSEVKKIMNNAFVNAYKAVLEEAQAADNSPDEYDTTLCMVIFDDGHVFYGQSGDSGIIALMKSGEYVPLTTQQRDEDGYVFPLCSGPSMWVFGEVEAPVSSVMLMTDGVWEQICPPLLRNHDVKINVALASRFMDRHETSLRSVKALEEAASRYLENYPRKLLDDDKTIVVIYNPLQPAKKMPADYYKAPDWTSLQEAAKANLYADDDSAEKTHKGSEEELAEHPSEDSDTPVPEDQLDKGDCGSPVGDADDISTHSEIDHPHTPDVELDPIVVSSHAKPQRANNSSTNKRHKHIEDPKKKDHIARRRDVGAARLYDFLSVLILVVFSITAFAMNGFVKEHAPETYLGVFLVCFIANSTVLLPAPSILVVLQYSMILNPVVVAICGALGASLGEMVGFMTGAHGRHFVSGKLIRKIEDHFPSHPYIFVLVFSALPLPLFDVVGMMAGAIRLNKIKFYLICFAGKLFKMLMFVWMGQVVANYIPR